MNHETSPPAILRSSVVALILIAVSSAVGCAARSPSRAASPAPAAAGITAEELAATIRFLADDALEGRGPGTRADRLTRLYIATRMQGLGLQPGGPNASWEQPFELLGISSRAPQRWRFNAGKRVLDLEQSTDFVAGSALDSPQVSIDGAEIAFVGFGIQAPEFQWDDFKGVDLRGKILLILNNDPDWDPNLFAGKRRLYYGRWTYKYESAARQGAVGAIIVHTDASAGYPWQTVQTSWGGENSRLPGSDGDKIKLQSWISEASAERLVSLAGQDWASLVAAARKRDFRPVPLGVTTSITLRNTIRRYQTANVIGILPGSDVTLREQAVVYTAHHDHLGMKPGGAGADAIYNGAVDNATGVAQLLALARAFTALPEAPRRSVLFVALGAEEQGLLGSEYFARQPTLPPSRMAANLNLDGGNIWGSTRDVAGIGFGKSSLDAYVIEACQRQGRTYTDEQFPDKGSFYRSDQFNFAKIGVPALFLENGTDFAGRPPGWGREQVEGWIATHYHQPSDEYDPSWNLEGMVADTQLQFEVGLAVAQADDMPRWNPGDEFEAVRLRSLAGQAR